jgi:FlaA1/EpsC-like NDP-sugar epimerase
MLLQGTFMKRLGSKFGIDLLIWMFALPLAYYLRIEEGVFQQIEAVVGISLLVLPVKVLIIYYKKFYCQSWHRLWIWDLTSIIQGIAIYEAIFLGIAIIFRDTLLIPLSIPFIEAMLLVVGMGVFRLVTRLWYEFKDQSMRRITVKSKKGFNCRGGRCRYDDCS